MTIKFNDNTGLIQAVLKDDVDQVWMALEYRANPNVVVQQYDRQLGLIHVCRSAKVFQELILHGAIVDDDVIDVAASLEKKKHPELLDWLICYTVLEDKADLTERLIRAGANVNTPLLYVYGAYSGYGLDHQFTLIHAVQSEVLFNLLVRSMVKISHRTLAVACIGPLKSHPNLVQWLLDYGLPADGVEKPNAGNYADALPLVAAAKTGAVGRLQVLLRNNANPNIRPFSEPYYAMHAALDGYCFSGRNGETDGNDEEGHYKEGVGFLAYSRKKDFGLHVECIKSLRLAGAKVDCRDIEGQTPVMQAARQMDWKMVELLLGWGASPISTDLRGRSLQWFAENPNQDPFKNIPDMPGSSKEKTIALIGDAVRVFRASRTDA